MASQALTAQGDAPRQNLSPSAEVRRDLERMGDQLKMALPSHVSVEKFQRVAMTAIQSDPDLLYADRQTLFASVTRAAQDGLLPDKREGALVIFNTKVKRNGKDEWVKAVQWMPMVAGILKKVRQSGEIASISANVVYTNDAFVWKQGDEELIEHQPAPLGTSRGEAIGAYAIATLKDGSRYREVMDIDQINKVRSVSRSGDKGPWKDWWEEMAKKTVIRRLSKRLPMSTDLESVVNDETTTADFSQSAAAVMNAPQRLSSAMLAQQAGTAMIEHDDDGVITNEQDAEPEQGRTDEQHGDQFDGTEPEREAEQAIPRWHDDVQRITDDLYTAQTMADIKAAGTELDKVRASLPEAEVTRLESLIADAKAAFQAKGA